MNDSRIDFPLLETRPGGMIPTPLSSQGELYFHSFLIARDGTWVMAGNFLYEPNPLFYQPEGGGRWECVAGVSWTMSVLAQDVKGDVLVLMNDYRTVSVLAVPLNSSAATSSSTAAAPPSSASSSLSVSSAQATSSSWQWAFCGCPRHCRRAVSGVGCGPDLGVAVCVAPSQAGSGAREVGPEGHVRGHSAVSHAPTHTGRFVPLKLSLRVSRYPSQSSSVNALSLRNTEEGELPSPASGDVEGEDEKKNSRRRKISSGVEVDNTAVGPPGRSPLLPRRCRAGDTAGAAGRAG